MDWMFVSHQNSYAEALIQMQWSLEVWPLGVN